MKLISCECCGSNELKRQKDGSYKCDFCGSVFILDGNEVIKDSEVVEAEIVSLYFEAEDYRRINKYGDEIRVLTKALERDNSRTITWVKLGRAYRMVGLVDKAIDCYHKAIEQDGSYAQSYTNIGSAYIIKKDYAQAVEFFEKGIALIDSNDIDYPTIIANYGIAVALNGNKIKGAKLINDAERRGYTDGKLARRMAGLSPFSILRWI